MFALHCPLPARPLDPLRTSSSHLESVSRWGSCRLPAASSVSEKRVQPELERKTPVQTGRLTLFKAESEVT